MSQLLKNNSGGGGSGITTISGDTGSITGSAVTIFANNATNINGSSVKFVNSGTTSTLRLVDPEGNVFIGFSAGNLGVISDSNENVGIGSGALSSIVNAQTCIAMGNLSLAALISGANVIALGNLSGFNLVSGNNDIRIGTSGTGDFQQSECFIAGISGVTVTGTAVLCDVNGQLGTVVSSERYKENIEDITNSDIIRNLRPVNFNYKLDKNKKKEFGLIAEEVAKICPDLVLFNEKDEPETVFYQYLPILLLQEVQRLNKKIEELEMRVA
jgi:hypothetical protein